MTLAHLALAMLVGFGAEPEETDLVARLGSPRFAQREAAARALETRGRRALPSLRLARDDKDPEIRARAAELIERIETGLLIKPTLVRLDYRDRPLAEVVKDLADQSGIGVSLYPDNNPNWAGRRVSLAEAQPLPFWQAIDALCRAGQLQPMPGMNVMGPHGSRVAALNLMNSGLPSAPPPTCDTGPFRVQVLAINHDRHLNFSQQNQGVVFGGAPPAPAVPDAARNVNVSDNFYLNLQVMVEPRMALANVGQVRIDEATDEAGHSLLPIAVPGQANAQVRTSGYFGYSNNPATSLPATAALRYPEQPGRTIKRLRGAVPVVVSARKDEPTVLNLAESRDKPSRAGDLTVIVRDVKANPNNPRQSQVELTIRPSPSAEAAARNAGQFAMNDFGMRLPNPASGLFEFLDAQGRLYTQWMPVNQQVRPDEAQVTLMLTATHPNLGPPTQLRIYDTTRAEAEAAFDFADLPMP